MNWNSDKSMNGELGDPSIDERLASPGQESVRKLIQAMPEEVPSLAWRSALNTRLAEQTSKARTRRRIWWVVSPSFGLAATAALCVVMFAPRHATTFAPAPKPISAPSLEDQLVASHSDSVMSQDVVGSGLSPSEVQQTSDDPDAQDAPAS